MRMPLDWTDEYIGVVTYGRELSKAEMKEYHLESYSLKKRIRYEVDEMQKKCNRCGKLFSPVNYADRECPECTSETEQKATAIYGEQECIAQEKEYVRPAHDDEGTITCEWCGKSFQPPTKSSRFCSRQCASWYTAKIKKERKEAMEEEMKAREALLELLQKASAVQTDDKDATSSLSEEELKIVYSQDHYTAGGVEVLDVLKAKLTPEQLFGFYIGNAIKYLTRLNFKGNKKLDLEKAHNYTGLAVEHLAKTEQE